MPKEFRIKDKTWLEWATRQFEYEYCAECHGDIEDHEPSIVLGNWFAWCRPKQTSSVLEPPHA